MGLGGRILRVLLIAILARRIAHILLKKIKNNENPKNRKKIEKTKNEEGNKEFWNSYFFIAHFKDIEI